MVPCAGATSLHRMVRHQHRRKKGGAPKREGAYVLGLQAGACFGLSAACCRTGACKVSLNYSL